ncbi:dynamin family protein [Xylariales sp. AK1849]|nr:dynamin family protein [Xylariales sp. AK1849]
MPHRAVKVERNERGETPSQRAQSAMSGTTAHSVAYNRQMAPPTAPSINQSFHRSDAPSVETSLERYPYPDSRSEGTHDTPQLLEMRSRNRDFQQAGRRRSTPSSHTGDVSFAQQSFTHISFTDIGMKLKACNDTLGELQKLGIQHVAQLPELVMVGDQSAGKSSLMSGLAELDLPRSEGVCTRCPIHIRLSRSNDPHWSCTVSLQQEYDYKPPGRPIKKTDVTKTHPFFPWVPKPQRIVKVFKTVHDKDDIEDVLRWAQVAILNHNMNPDLFVPDKGAYAKELSLARAVEETEAQFSPNIVALEIKGPSLPDLSFYDLPGVFMAPSQEDDEYLVRVVRNLSSHYIQRPQAIILWALPMNHDPENSISLGIIREAKALPRTIGVITKADIIATGTTAQWLAVLRGEKHPVGEGFFITARPSYEEDPDALECATHFEEQFFFSGNDERWPAEFQEFSHRCGVELLKDFLSKKLGDAFSSSLPSIKHKVNDRLNIIRDELSELPELPANVEHEVRKSLYSFYDTVKRSIRDSGFQAQWDTLNKQFQACILAMRPVCNIVSDEIIRGSADQPMDLTASGDDTSVAGDTPSRKRPRMSDSTVRGTPNKRLRQDGIPTTPVKQENPSFSRSTPTPIRHTMSEASALSPFAQYHHLGKRGLSIVSIREEISRRKRAGMPDGLIPSEVYDHLVLGAIKKWAEPARVYIESTMKLFSSVLHQALEHSMSTLSRRTIFTESKVHLGGYIQARGLRQESKIIDLLDTETHQMFTTNDETFKRYRDQEQETLQRARAIWRINNQGQWKGDPTPRPLEKMTKDERIKERTEILAGLSKIGTDDYQSEIDVAAVVRGYYILAAMRFVESATLHINSRLFREVAECDLDLFLDDKLGLMQANDSTYARLMEEDDAIAEKRRNLKHEMQKLGRASQSINDLEFGGACGLGGFDGVPVGGPVDLVGVVDEA